VALEGSACVYVLQLYSLTKVLFGAYCFVLLFGYTCVMLSYRSANIYHAYLVVDYIIVVFLDRRTCLTYFMWARRRASANG